MNVGLCGIVAIACGFAASYAGSRGVIDGGEDAETNALRGCDAGDDRECLTRPEWRTKWRSERRTKWWAERRANRSVVDGDARWHAD